MKKLAAKIYESVINPPSDEKLSKAREESGMSLPTLWLLGKTGAGKSTIIQKLTGESAARIGNGFMPCTQGSAYFDYPKEHAILRFLDTRGLGEAGYDASEDIESLGKSSHAILVVMRVRDGEQSVVIEAIRQIRKSARHIRSSDIMVVHTGAEEVAEEHDRTRAVELKQQAVEQAWKAPLDHCQVDFGEVGPDGALNDVGADELSTLIGTKMPELKIWLQRSQRKSAEKSNFDRLSTEVLWYSSTAAASDAVPLVGLVSVPAIQGKMLHSLAQKYDIEWNTRSFSEFTAALGTGFAIRYAASLGGRQLTKLIPVYGQVVGTALSVVISYASTYALGRAACSYLYHKKTNTPLDEDSLRSIYSDAVAEGREAGKSMFGKDK
jgi:uncharacterized protein (DUF697 family)/GTP-binding protein EngB required for normal cell division